MLRQNILSNFVIYIPVFDKVKLYYENLISVASLYRTCEFILCAKLTKIRVSMMMVTKRKETYK